MGYFTFPHTTYYDGDVGWMLRQMEKLLACCESMEAWRIKHEAEYKELRALYDQIVAGDYPPEMERSLREWITANAGDLVGAAIRFVTVGLTNDGRLLLTMPDSWDAIRFATTGYDITVGGYDYGHLVMSY